MEGIIVKVIVMKQQYVTCSLVLLILLQLMEDGAVGHPGLLAVQIVEKGLKQEQESATNHRPLMEGHFVEDLLMKKQDVTCILVQLFLHQLMEAGALGNPGLLAVCPVEVELRQERKSVTTHALIMEEVIVPAMLPPIQNNATQIHVHA